MTREEAIEILEGLAVPIHAEPAFDMAIEALKAQADLQPNCNELATDCISRQAAIKAINQICPIDTEYDCTLLDRVDVRCVLTDLPSVQSEENCDTCKHGYFGDDKCNNCRVRYPSHYERRTDD